MKLTTKMMLLAALAFAFTACKQTEFKKTKEGYPYKIFSNGKGEKIMPGNVVRYHITQKLKDSLLGTTHGGNANFIPIPKDSVEHPLAKLMIEARKGDSIQVNQSIDSMIKKDPRLAEDPLLKKHKGEDLITIISIIEVYKDETAAQLVYEKENISNFNKQPAIAEQKKKDEAEIEAYLKANNIQTQRTPWGAYVQIINPGTGPKAAYGKFASVRYTGKDLAGTEFDSNNKPGAPAYPVQIGAGGSIPGFEDGIKQLAKGGKAIVFVPSVLGYGTQGSSVNPSTGKQSIKPNQNLVFEIEVLDVSDKQPAPPTMEPADTTKN